jgi:chemotaxis signal transduction protein
MLQPPPNVAAPQVNEFVCGVITSNDGIVTLLSLVAVIPPGEEFAA